MATAYTHQSSNVFKTYILMGLFLVCLAGLGYFVSVYYDNPALFYIAIIFSLVMNFASFWFSDKIVLSISKAREAKRQEFFDLYTVTENLSITAGLPMPKIYIIDDRAPNAFATGRDKEHAVVAVTTGLLQKLEKSELEGVIAHELSHIGNRDILLMSAVVVLVGFVSIISDMFLRGFMFRGGSRDNKSGGALAIVGIVLIILSPIIATLIKLAISRRREYLADASGALLTRYPEGLAKALEKIASFNIPMKTASTATAHLFISNPFGSKGTSISNLFQTHPPITERIKILRGLDN
ncbi:MAG: zinc metalloprotease HtpX [Candidatus Zambryskibacteria bacterium RIFCSPLOWO2_01_FULL_39_39]|uniref:Protease HtpX homolog n=1 Tax=Candidatus Zambryskibacteria bacterium RIFCSPLOWO2_01_FULL_39_39 TaxID=1802758 RepID=A0A1G2TVS4_9BACT|nr:MAG: Protease HtpX-like protein [Parcubacteria group bacterium GW2011_GWA1_38_7]OHA86607.1 MAG: zinc metalloprotease HtpX [Candidatus Zambryskibacteria bacterium RIFCSPHIGHO2_01_FULL_39_63]OHA94224.1 MAG: zinc metalloprotease HtpX [Candidatus Zambryskibacteria bacterium RIFCSPHIGHO2_02_FULL_39_19]OHA98509.1 MAG: zinc metalloprotease HtpX [Candidatus Zambryskibacteria bacterium RIFCSPHIGHO2_12_FULL_39_21]OHB01428.1 MAG: zinc metalloprotease HtpX [Candidatus Zambryskibacteria bacterium RIFCSPL